MKRSEQFFSRIERSVGSAAFIVFQALGNPSVNYGFGNQSHFAFFHFSFQQIAHFHSHLRAECCWQSYLEFGFNPYERHVGDPMKS